MHVTHSSSFSSQEDFPVSGIDDRVAKQGKVGCTPEVSVMAVTLAV